jgi:hypothetical protein
MIAALPFVVALVLNVLVYSDKHSKHITGYCFLFATPWAWLLDRDWFFGHATARWVGNLEDLVVILWGPALLYSLCLCALMWLAGRATHGGRARSSRPRIS